MLSILGFTLALPEDIPELPHQPDAGYKFPKCSFGKKTVNCSFSAQLVLEGTVSVLQRTKQHSLPPYLSVHVQGKESEVFYQSRSGIRKHIAAAT